VLPAAERESKFHEALLLSVVVFWSDLESDVVQRAGAHQRLVGGVMPRDQHYLLRNARPLRTDAQELDGQLRWRDRLQSKRVTVESHGSVDILDDQHYLDKTANARHPRTPTSELLRCESREFKCRDIRLGTVPYGIRSTVAW